MQIKQSKRFACIASSGFYDIAQSAIVLFRSPVRSPCWVTSRVLTTRAGFPRATEKSGMSLVTTLPAPMVQPRPIVTPALQEMKRRAVVNDLSCSAVQHWTLASSV
ncbi:hypothetical protein BCV69DRAFT_283266 [Microstroma glucosiphilum]|uniref:Uncharacterized protein n=1 Tax=Pseudomicrostroma glucosiphilum TaxID=1684307 RepID=A0A316UBI4_9BASI|nr:hypothetical protein BCV69DRAFT_283266 [Pseudomicrostroma glucosiphilum]PWN20385.1 hypothetical protein BCV69DRAFT_283266 [Pseudomicrostroma glucosiphilum]